MRKIGNSRYVLLAVMLIMGLAYSCKDEDDGGNGGNGKIDPGTIATANLIAHFPFENNGNDAITGLAPVESANSFVNGQRGMAYQGVNEGYFLYNLPASSKFTSLKAFTIAMWFYGAPALEGVDEVPGIIQLNGTTDQVWGNLTLTQDRMPAAADSLNIKLQFHKEGATWNNQFVGFSKPEFTENLWIHLAFTYDNNTSTYKVYVNGEPLDLDEGITMRWADAPEVDPRPALGDLVFANVTQLAIGGWYAKITGALNDVWMGYFTGQMDELRFYDKGLSAAEVKSLFEAEVTQLE